MWVIEGPFDGVELKQKVLYPGETYPFGRASDILNFRQPTISAEQGFIKVAKHPLSDASDAEAIPIVTYEQKKKSAKIDRVGEEIIPVPAGGSTELKHGDIIYVTSGSIYLTLTWVPVNVLIRSGISRDERNTLTTSLAKLGIKSAFRTYNPFITHVVFSTVPPPPHTDLKILVPLAASVHFVSPAWLPHVVKRGSTNLEDENALIVGFKGLDEAQFRSDGTGLEAWKPHPKRKVLFKGVKFHLLTVTDAPQDLITLLTIASGGLLTIHQIPPVSDAADEEWDSKLSDLKRKADKYMKPAELPGLDSPFVLVGDEDALRKELGQERWEEVYKTAMERQAILDIRMIWLPQIAEALLKMDLSPVSSASAPEPPLPVSEVAAEPVPAFIPSTHPSEPSVEPNQQSAGSVQPIPAVKKLTRRVTGSKQTTPAPEQPPDPTVRRNTRRSGSVVPAPAGPQATSSEAVSQADPKATPETPMVDDDDFPIEIPKTILKRRVTRRAASKEPSAPAPAGPASTSIEGSGTPMSIDNDDYLLAPPAIPVRALKRRVTGRAKAGSSEPEPSTNSGSIGESQIAEAPHKKYKALFDGTQLPVALESVAEEEDANSLAGPSTLKRKASGSETAADRRKKTKESAGSADTEQSASTSRAALPGSGLRSQESAIGDESNVSANSQNPSDSTSTHKFKPHTQSTQAKKVRIQASEDDDEHSGERAESITVDPKLQSLLQTKSRKTGATAGLDKEFSHLRLTAHPAERLKLAEEERLRREMEVWQELQQKEKEEGGSLEGETGMRGNFMVVIYRDDLIKPQGEKAPRTSTWGGHPGAVPNFKKFRKKNIARGPKVELELPAAVDYGMGDTYWEAHGNTTMGGEALNPLAVDGSGQTGGVNDSTQQPRPRQKKSLQLKVHSSSEDEADVQLKNKSKAKGKGRAKPAPQKIDLHFSDLEEEDEPSAPRAASATRLTNGDDDDKSENFDLNVSGDEDDDVPSTGRTIRSSGRSQPSAGARGTTQSQRSAGTSTTTSGRKRKAVIPDPIEEEDDDDDDDDDSDDGAFKGFKRKPAKKKTKR